ncbi:ROK family protein [Bacteroidales bacterium OttesenSCG-928-M11]|nr:ROK family protein [Bacteroidales bacterium OttesenSCG-928-M11]
MKKKYSVGADIGGGHIEAAVVNITDFQIIKETKTYIPVKNDSDADTILNAWAEAINTSVQKAIESGIHKEDIKGIGLAIPGPFNYSLGISLMDHKFKSLYVQNICEKLAIRTDFRGSRIKFKNDAESFLLGEVLKNTKKNIKEAVGITLGTGFGSAFFTENESQDANLWCSPYRGGKAEDFISSQWFIKKHKEVTGEEIEGVKNLVDRYEEDAHIRNLFTEFGETLDDFLTPLATEFRADAIIIGGSICKAEKLFTQTLRSSLPETIQLIVSESTEEAAMIGAASLLQAIK